MKRKFSLYIKEVIYVCIRGAPYIPNVSKKKEKSYKQKYISSDLIAGKEKIE